MTKKPKLQDLVAAKQVLKKWYITAKNRNKKSAMYQTQQIYELLDYLESIVDWRKFED